MKGRWRTKKGDRNCGWHLIAAHLGGYTCLASSKQKRYHYFKINGYNDFACALILQNLEGESWIILKLLWQAPCTISRCWQPCTWAVLFTWAVWYQERHQEKKLCCVSSSSLFAHMAFYCVAVALDKGRGGMICGLPWCDQWGAQGFAAQGCPCPQ